MSASNLFLSMNVYLIGNIPVLKHPRKRNMPRNSICSGSISYLSRCCLSVLYYCLRRCRSIVFPSFSGNLVLRHVNLFSSVISHRCYPFRYDELCKLNLLFTFLPICAFMSPPMMGTLCFRMLRTREDSSL